PMIAPAVGAYVTAHLAWQYVFIVLGAITLLIIAGVYFFLPEGRKADDTISLKPKAVLANFGEVIRNPQFFIYTAAGGLATAAPFAYIAGSSDVFMNIHHLTEKQY